MFIRKLLQSIVVGLLSLAFSSLFVGCQSLTPKWDVKKLAFWKKDEVTDGSNARKMVAIWSENTAYGKGVQPQRGLGGRLYFYDAQHKPIKVDGELVVYAYDDSKSDEKETADRKYVITEDQFQEHYSETEFGPSYSVWIPWDRVGNNQTAISVVPVIKTKSGQVLVGDHSRGMLAGKKENLRKNTTTYQLGQKRHEIASDVQHVSYNDNLNSPRANHPKGIRRTTISLSPGLQQRALVAGQIQKQQRAKAREAMSSIDNDTDESSSTGPKTLYSDFQPKRQVRPRHPIYPAPAKQDQQPTLYPAEN